MVVLSLAFLFTLLPHILTAQDTEPLLDVDLRGVPSGGYVLAAPLRQDTFGFIDLSGRLIFKRGVGLHTNLQAHGSNRVSVFTGNLGVFNYIIFDSALAPVDTVSVTSPYYTDSHEGVMWSDSTFMMLGIEFRSFDMSKVVDGGQPNATLMVTVIQERHLTTDSVLYEWNAFGRIPVTDATPNIELRQRTIDYIHANSIARDNDGDLIVSCRHLDEVIKIRRSDGSIVWRLGGVASKNKQFTFVDDDHDDVQGFSHQHTAFRTKRGTIMLFDNGNLKPQQRSRVVEYALDTVAMTATRIWSYTPDPPLYSPSQGSIQELPNGNIFVGYSATNDQRVAEEVDRNGAIVMQLRNRSQMALQPYRVMKTAMACTSIEHMIDAPRDYVYADADSTTGITLSVAELLRPTKSRVERHHYAPHDWTIVDSTLCGPLSMRWTLRFDTASSLRGSTIVGVSHYTSPESIVVHHRRIEGIGSFTPIAATFNDDRNAIIIDSVLPGEYAIAYRICPEVVTVAPADQSMNVSTPVVLRWSEAPDATGYDVQMSLQSDLSSPFLDATTLRRDTVIVDLPAATQLYWRARKRQPSSLGQWSAIASFTTSQTVGVEHSGGLSRSDVRVLWQDGLLRIVGDYHTPMNVEVFNLLGVVVARGHVDLTNGLVHGVDQHQLPRVMIVRVSSPGAVHLQQLLIARH